MLLQRHLVHPAASDATIKRSPSTTGRSETVASAARQPPTVSSPALKKLCLTALTPAAVCSQHAFGFREEAATDTGSSSPHLSPTIPQKLPRVVKHRKKATYILKPPDRRTVIHERHQSNAAFSITNMTSEQSFPEEAHEKHSSELLNTAVSSVHLTDKCCQNREKKN